MKYILQLKLKIRRNIDDNLLLDRETKRDMLSGRILRVFSSFIIVLSVHDRLYFYKQSGISSQRCSLTRQWDIESTDSALLSRFTLFDFFSYSYQNNLG